MYESETKFAFKIVMMICLSYAAQ